MGTLHSQVQASTTYASLPVQTGLFRKPAVEFDSVDPAHDQATTAFNAQPAAGSGRFSHSFGRVGVLQAKLTVGAPGDRYEQEADRVADQVLATPDPQPIQREVAPEEEEQVQTKPALQREEADEVQTKPIVVQREAAPDEEELQAKPVLQREEADEEVQAKPVTVQREATPEEDEQVQAKPTFRIQREAVPEEDEPVQTSPDRQHTPRGPPTEESRCSACTAEIQREAAPEEEEVQTKPALQRQEGEDEEVQTKPVTLQREAAPEEDEQVQTRSALQRKAQTIHSPAAPASLESRLAGRKGSGMAMPAETRSFMEPRFGVDFSGVRVHTGTEAVQMNRELRAQAFTHGSDIYFGEGKYDPGSTGGKQLLAHELTHVVQQTGGVQRKPSTGRPLPSITSLSGGLVQRKTAVCEPPPQKVLVAPGQDPKFQAVGSKIHQTGSKTKQHPPASAKADEAQKAAAGPPNEVASQGAANQVGKMEQAKPGTFDKAAFIAALHQAIDRITPQNLEQADDFKQSGKAGEMKAEVGSRVGQGKDDSARNVKETSQAAPDSAGAKPKDVTPLAKTAPGAAPADVKAEKAMPGPKSAAETSLAHGKCETDQMMKEANVTEDQLKKSNEPEFTGAVDAKKQADTDVRTAPQAVKTQETAVLAQAKAGAGGQAAAGTTAMHSKKAAALAKVMGQQEATKGKDEGERAKVSGKLQELYSKTKEDVTKILDGLEGKVNAAFDSGEQAARSAFENHVDTRMRKYKDERYDGLTGGALWVKDKLLGMPSEVNAFYKEGRSLYIKQMDAVINRVANVVAAELSNAKNRIAQGRLEIKQYIDGLPKNLRKLGLEAQEKVQDQFGELDRSVDEKQNSLIDSLAQRYVAARDTVDKRIDEMKAENKGLVDKAMEALGGVIETILKLKEMLAGALAKAAGVIDQIIKDPMQFLSNLLAAIKQGFNMFVGNIAAHLKKGLMGWLFGALADAGIDLPESFDLKGILKLVASIIGLTYANIRSRAVSMVGEKVVAGIEKTAEIFIILKNEGISGIWKLIQDKLSDLKETVMGGIKDFVITKIITAGVTWVVSLFNPASAFIKACKMIYDVVMFFVERGSQIMALVNSILDSIGAIANGAIGGAAAMVEQSLAKALPVAISFLASLLGIGGIAGKIKELLEKVQVPVNKAVDWLVTNVVGKFKKFFGKGLAKAKGFVNKAKAKGKALLEKGKQKVNAAGSWVKGKLGFGKDTQEAKEDPEHDKKVHVGLKQLHELEATHAQTGKLTLENAKNVAAQTRQKNSVFKSIEVIDGKTSWNYRYVASPIEVEKGHEHKADDNKIHQGNVTVKSNIKKRKDGTKFWSAEVLCKTADKGFLLAIAERKPDQQEFEMLLQPESKLAIPLAEGVSLKELVESKLKDSYSKYEKPTLVTEKDLSAKEGSLNKKTTGDELGLTFYALVEGTETFWGMATIKLPTTSATGEVKLGAATHALFAKDLVINDEVRSRIQLDKGRLTEFALRKTNEIYNKHTSEGDVPRMEGNLAEDNKQRFQSEFERIKRENPSMSNDAAAGQAVLETPFAKGRIPLGYTKFTCALGKESEFEDRNGVRVPTSIYVTGEKPK